MNDKEIDKTLEIAAELERTPNWAIGTHTEEVMNAGASAIKSLVGHILELQHNLDAVQINSGINFRMWKEAIGGTEMIQQENNTTTTKTTGYTQYCSNKLPCGICRLMQAACPLTVKSWDTKSKNPYDVTIVDYGKEAQE